MIDKKTKPDNVLERDYWIDAREWTDSELSSMSSHISEFVARGIGGNKRDDKNSCEFLFALSQKSLPEIRGNYFWPSAYKEVIRRIENNSSGFSEQKFQKYFRGAIASAYPRNLSRLQRQQIHHKYVALIFQQAGIGKNRNHILKGFLEYLVEHARYSLNGGPDAHSIVLKVLNEFVRDTPESERADVQFLSSVLMRIGEEVIVLARTLEAEPSRSEIFNWSWERLREYWLSKSGVDLHELTPSAGQVLIELISHLSTIWLRSEIFRLSKGGKISVVLPGRMKLTDCNGYRDIPLGPGEVTLNGNNRSVVIVDRLELGPKKLLHVEKNVWHWLDDGYAYKVSETRFDVKIRGGGYQRAVPFFTGNRPPDAERGGYYWGGTYQLLGMIDEHVPNDIARRRPKSELNMHYGFKWRNDRLFLELNGFGVAIKDDENCYLDIGGARAWRGAIKDSRPEEFRRKLIDSTRLKVEVDGSIKAQFVSGSGEELGQTFVLWPLSDEAFLVVNRKLYRSGASILLWQIDDQKPEFYFYSTKTDAEPVLHNLNVIEEATCQVHEYQFRQWKLGFVTSREARVRLGDSWWKIDCRSSLKLSYLTGREVVKSNVYVSGVSNVRVIENPSEIRLQTYTSRNFEEEGLGVWVQNAGTQAFCALDQSDTRQGALSTEIDIYSALARYYLQPEPGEIRIAIGTAESKSSMTFHFFLLPEEIGIRNTRFLEPSRIFIGVGDPSHDIRSDEIVNLAVIEEKKFVRAKIYGADWEVWFRWKPHIFDLTLGGQLGAECNYTFSISKRSFGEPISHLPCRLYAYGESGSAEIHILDSVVECQPGNEIDLLPFLISSDRPLGGKEINVSSQMGSGLVEWTINFDPAVIRLECIVSGRFSGFIELLVKIHVVGFNNEQFTVICVSNNAVLERRDFYFDPSILSYPTAEMSLAIPLVKIENENINVLVLRGESEISRATVSVPPDETDKSVTPNETDKYSLDALIASYKRTASLELLPKIMEQSIGLFSCLSQNEAISTIRNVIFQVGGIRGNDDDNWLIVGLRSLEYVASGSVRSVQVPLQVTKSSDLCVSSIALWVMLADRLAERGKLVPDHFNRAMKIFECALHSEELTSEWANDSGRLAYAFAAGFHSRYGDSFTTMGEYININQLPRKSAAAAMLATISRNFKDWLEST